MKRHRYVVTCDVCKIEDVSDPSDYYSNIPIPKHWETTSSNQDICPDCLHDWKKVQKDIQKLENDFWKGIEA